MAIPSCEAEETTLGRLERAGDKWGLPPFKDKTMKGKKRRRNKAGSTNECLPLACWCWGPGLVFRGVSEPPAT